MDSIQLTVMPAPSMTLSARSESTAMADAMADEREWLAAARGGEPWALERFYRSYVTSIHALCVRMLGRPHDAEDAVQSAFVQAFRALPRFRGDCTTKTWIYRIAMNQCISVLRRRRESGEIPDTAAGSDDTATVIARESVLAALRQIPPDRKAILVLRYWEEMDCEDIAAVLGISVSAAKMRLHRARLEFKTHYEGDL